MSKLNKAIIVILGVVGMCAVGYANVTASDNVTQKLGSSLYLYAPVF